MREGFLFKVIMWLTFAVVVGYIVLFFKIVLKT